MALGRKQSSKNDDWVKAWENCTEIVSKEHIRELTNRTIQRIRAVISLNGYKRIGYAWSGGKDSIVLYDIIRKSGIDIAAGVFIQYEHEFPEFLEWIAQHKPSDCVVRYTHAYTDDFLNKHPEYLFPVDKDCAASYNPQRWKVQTEFVREYRLDCLILGRRLADGNNCGKKEHGYTTNSKAGNKMNPIADWSHEELLAYIRHNNLPLPPTYFYENGFKAGTQVWTEKRRINGHYFETFDLLMSIDPRIVESVRGKLRLADEYIEYKKNGGVLK